MNKKRVLMITETALLIAFATVLSIVKLFELPYGGSITAFSVVPIVIISFRYGVKWGMLAGFVYSLIQLLLGAHTLSYATSAVAAIAIVLLDYIFAFSCYGLASVFKKQINNASVAAATGTFLVCAIRFIFHVISGCTVWAGISIPTGAALVYSLSYNATYMIPETIINVAMAFWIFKTLDFNEASITRAEKQKTSLVSLLFSSLSILSLVAAIVIDAVAFFMPLQNAESGELDFSLVSNVFYPLIIIASIAGVVLCALFQILSIVSKKKATKG